MYITLIDIRLVLAYVYQVDIHSGPRRWLDTDEGLTQAKELAMAQATYSLSRRSLLGTLASVPVGVLHTIAIVSPDAGLLTLEQQVVALAEIYQEATDSRERAERAFKAWLDRNPQPKFDSDRFHRLREQREDDAGWPQIEEAYFKEVASRGKRWRGARDRAQHQCGLPVASAASQKAASELDDACSDVLERPALTVAGLQMKARLARHNEDMAHSIVLDLLAMPQV